jgi:hypothetical protein
MSRRSIRRFLRKARFPLAGWLMVAMYFLVACGVPLPLPSPHADSARVDKTTPFPCMDHRCGCHSAEQCWTNCCCQTPSERLAWARARGLELPGEYLAKCARQDGAAGRASCCAKPPRPAAPNSGIDEVDGSVILLRALACQSAASKWLSCCVAVPLVTLDNSVSLAPRGIVSLPPAAHFSSPAEEPPVPPPREARG